MVIGVVKEERVRHFFDRCLAARAGVSLAVGKLEPALATHDLVLFLSGHHPVTLATTDEAGESKFKVRLRPRTAVAAKQSLHPVIFRFGDHRLVLSLIPLVAAVWIFKPAVIEGLGEDLVDGASAKRLATHLARWPRAEGPLFVGDFQNSRRGVEAGQHQIPHATEQRKTLRIFDQSVFARQLVGVVQVACRGDAGIPAVFGLGLESPFYVFAQVVHVFLRHAEFDIHEDDIVIFTGVSLGRGHDPDAMLFDAPDDGTSVHRITRQTIKFPADDAGSFTTVKALHHLIEHRAPRIFCGFRLGQYFDNL
ncbi:MAG: hypothetical protein WC735_01355 [Candidatus Paceibacterota bacterium]